MSDINIIVTQESFDENFSIEDWFNFDKLSNIEMYQVMLKFVCDADGNPLPEDEARKQFKQVKKAEWVEYVNKFMQAISEAFVNPTNGG